MPHVSYRIVSYRAKVSKREYELQVTHSLIVPAPKLQSAATAAGDSHGSQNETSMVVYCEKLL